MLCFFTFSLFFYFFSRPLWLPPINLVRLHLGGDRTSEPPLVADSQYAFKIDSFSLFLHLARLT